MTCRDFTSAAKALIPLAELTARLKTRPFKSFLTYGAKSWDAILAGSNWNALPHALVEEQRGQKSPGQDDKKEKEDHKLA